jgi:hypothetical protein
MSSDFLTASDASSGATGLTEKAPAAGPLPGGETPTHRGRRRLVVVAALVVVVLVAAMIALVTRGDDGETDPSTGGPPASSTATATPTTPSTAPSTTTRPSADTTGPPAATTGPPATTSPPGALPNDPSDYAVAAFTAWQQGDMTALAELAEPSVAGFLAARTPSEATWGDPQHEGAMGSTYSMWTRPETQFVLRVRNEQASAGEPHAVMDAYFLPGPGRVAIWPVTTQDEATTVQAEVEQGHQPWRIDPAAVATGYAEAALGWQDAVVEPTRSGVYRVTDGASGTVADVTLTQPARTGEGGIWAISRVGSA